MTDDHRTDRITSTLPTTFVPAEMERGLYERWVAGGYFRADSGSGKDAYSIVIPPPNVNGRLHVGHAFEHTLIDVLARWRRMRGFETLWLPGMDHGGISTQNTVERELVGEGLSRHDLGRERFAERVWESAGRSGEQIVRQMRRLGDGVDWGRERFTLDDGLSRAVQTIFKRLFDDGLIYRAERIINWCPRCATALSDIEVDYRDVDGELVSIRYGDADEHVDPEFGTGAVKVTPAHDPNDFEIGRRHGLPSLTVLDELGAITAHGPFQGLDRFEARAAIVAALREEGRIVAEQRPYGHAVGHCSRCGTAVEPRQSLQWWVRVAPLARMAGDAVRDGRVRIHPDALASRYFAWVDNMRDWCISRQLWWGHRIPVWYGPEGETVCLGPGETPPAGQGWTQDPDVLDTWFSSGLWPFSTLGWPERTEALAKFYPNSVLFTGYDLMFFWVARMMMFGLYISDGQTPPFGAIALHGMVRDGNGRKMSKSFGNVVDPDDWMDTYGTDALRFALARAANPGADAPIAEESVAGARNFTTKIWNATRFALLNGATVDGGLPAAEQLPTLDRWILSRLNRIVTETDAYLDDYQFAKAADLLYHFAWDEIFAWYLELAKPALAQPNSAKTRRVLGHVLDTLLRLLHPIIPFVTEQLWTTLTGGESVVIAAWPTDTGFRDPTAETEVVAVQGFIGEIRRFRSEQRIPASRTVPARLELTAALSAHEAAIRRLARLDSPGADFRPTATLPIGRSRIEIDLSRAIDVDAERRRLEKDLHTARKDLDATGRRLADRNFLAKAPADVVQGIRRRKDRAERDIRGIEERLTGLSAD
ncbi:valine--tRNA ligase [Nocardia terpenica]|uniref:Valine--tRNA ligase n=1 Tax=Nocardia terpenica TaxID=455432 RepID=A0A164NZF5_9NOCA|nr:valine--tRNA ligase [Nocardia terpenica]KZM74917.1 valine--tRNA ligase [Nocardia terpenica]NQE93423.1 valine--tRNA ligase [Nocardia terpenica]